MIKNNKVYDTLKYISQIVLPALGALYYGLGDIWSFPKVTQVVGTISIIATFLGVILGLSSRAYRNSSERFDGAIDTVKDGDKTVYSMNVDGDPEKLLEKKDELTFRVNKGEPVEIVVPPKPKKKASRKKS